MSSYMDAMQVLNPGARCAINEDTGDVVEWYETYEPPTKAQLREQYDAMNAAQS